MRNPTASITKRHHSSLGCASLNPNYELFGPDLQLNSGVEAEKPYHRVEYSCPVVKEVRAVSHTWELREGKVLVVEDANTASLVVVARDLKDRDDKVAVLEEILRKLRT
jgi:hypothetical protein